MTALSPGASGASPTLSTGDVLETVLVHAAARPASLAVRDDTSTYTYGELVQRAADAASGLRALGVAPGDRVALHLGNSADFVVMALGCLWLGAPFVALQVDSPLPRLAGILADCEATVVVTPAASADGGPGLPGRVVTTAAVLAAATGPVPRATSPGRDVYLVYTSGTTGRPKGVCIQENAFNWSVGRTVDALGLDETARALAVSAFHFDGSYGLVFPVLAAGGSLLVPRREDILFLRRFFQLVVDEGVTFCSFSPSYLRLVVSSRQFPRLAASKLRLLLLGGEQCVAADVERLWSVRPEVRVFNRYGPTEATIAVTTYPVTTADVASGRVPIGLPHPGVDFYLIGEQGQVLDGPERTGELYVGGEQLMRGYWGDEQLSRRVLRPDTVAGRTLYKTGDLVYRDGRGLYFYAGRLDDVVKRNGVRISLEEVAGAVRTTPGVTGAWCALVDLAGAPGIAAFVEAGPEVTVQDVVTAAAKRLPGAMLPDEVLLVAALPMTHQGKVDRRRLLADSRLTAWQPPG